MAEEPPPPTESLLIQFYGGIKELRICTNTRNELSYTDVIWSCIRHLEDNNICDSDTPVEGPKYFPTFGLVASGPSGSIWLPHSHTFEKISDTDRVYSFRVRFHVPAERVYDSNIMTEYLFLQTMDDFLMGPLGDNKKLNDETLFRLLVFAFLMPEKLPYRNKQKVDKNFVSKSFSMLNFTNFFSKTIAKRFIAQKMVDHIWVYKALKKSIKQHKELSNPLYLEYFKHHFYEVLTKDVPTGCHEEYEAIPIRERNEGVTQLNIGIYMMEPALYYGEVPMCSIKDICTMKLIKPKNKDARVWHVELDVQSKPPEILEFRKEGQAESFMSMIQSYVQLYICYDLCLTKDLQTWQSRVSSELRSFGPISQERAQDYLQQTVEDAGGLRYLIHESLTDYEHYVVVSCSPREQDTRQRSKGFNYHTLSVLCWSATRFELKTDAGKQIFNSSLSLRKYLISFGQQVYPKCFSVIAEINEVFGVEMDYTSPHEDGIPKEHIVPHRAEQETSMPLPVIKSDLTDIIPIPDKNPLVKKYEVYLRGEKMMLVQLQQQKGKYSKSFREGIERLLKLSRIKPKNFLKFYNMVVEAQFSVLMELPPLGDLLTYICTNKNTVAQKVHIMYEIIKILHVMEGHRLYHGNIRSRKFLVFHGEVEGFVDIKLGDPGISSYLDTLPLTGKENDERIPWLSPERRQKLEQITYESECYAVGTTLCEILYRNDDFHKELGLKGQENLRTYLAEHKHLPPPPLLADKEEGAEAAAEDTDNALLPEAKDVLRRVWNTIILKCWVEEEMERPSVVTLLNDFSDLRTAARELVGDTPLEELKQVVYDVGFKDEQSASGNSPQTVNECYEKLRNFYPGKFLNPDCIDMESWKKLGVGHFGAVWRCKIRQPRQNKQQEKGPAKVVAVKRIKKQSGADEKMFVKEVLLACKLEHPNIVEVLHFSWVQAADKEFSALVLIMENMNGGNLSTFAKDYGDLNRPDKVEQMIKICLDVAQGMVYLSGKSIVHRDLAARNVLLSRREDGTIIAAKVSDFGLARNMEGYYSFYRLKIYETLPFLWMPPECLDNDAPARFSSKGDVWSFGITMWEAFSCGRRPETQMDSRIRNDFGILLKQYENGWRLKKNPTMSDAVYGVMRACWEFVPRERPPFVEVVPKLQRVLNSIRPIITTSA